LDVILVGAGQNFPVDGPHLVAGRVGAVVEVLDGEAVVRTAVPAREEPLDDLAGHQLHVSNARQSFAVEVLRGGYAGSLLVSNSLSITWSAVTPSLSARKLVARRCRSTGRAT